DVLNVYTTDAEVYIESNVPANVFELENGTVLVQSDEFAKYGTYNWNVEFHTISIDFTDKNITLPLQPFHNVLGLNDINDIAYGVIVENTEKRCADIDYEDLRKWLEVYWNFNFERVIAPMGAYNMEGNYIKLWNKDKSEAYTVFPNGGVIAGRYGEPCESHGEIKANYIWYLPVISNSRSALNSANMKLNFTYLREIQEVEYKAEKQRKFATEDEISFPERNLLNISNASDWAKYEIQKAAACNLLPYELTNKYQNDITRKEFCDLIYRLVATEFSPDSDSRMGQWSAIDNVIYERQLTDKVNSVSFSDCEDDKIKFLSGAGIIYGMGNGMFAPDESITREQASTILYRTAEFLGNKTMPTATKISYTDENEISDWAKSSVACMTAMGIMNGVSKTEFSPKGSYTVEQAIATMVRLYECY
ncbi:MAG: S-layer homology domain-containing protein, partial [Clostridia bacterium]|nr:S-layer homology domain-containing protein [Clostridia bacterium]